MYLKSQETLRKDKGMKKRQKEAAERSTMTDTHTKEVASNKDRDSARERQTVSEGLGQGPYVTAIQHECRVQ